MPRRLILLPAAREAVLWRISEGNEQIFSRASPRFTAADGPVVAMKRARHSRPSWLVFLYYDRRPLCALVNADKKEIWQIRIDAPRFLFRQGIAVRGELLKKDVFWAEDMSGFDDLITRLHKLGELELRSPDLKVHVKFAMAGSALQAFARKPQWNTDLIIMQGQCVWRWSTETLVYIPSTEEGLSAFREACPGLTLELVTDRKIISGGGVQALVAVAKKNPNDRTHIWLLVKRLADDNDEVMTPRAFVEALRRVGLGVDVVVRRMQQTQ